MEGLTRDLAAFKKLQTGMVTINDRDLPQSQSYFDFERSRVYSLEEVERIIEDVSSLQSAQELSRHYFMIDGFYKKIILYYATLLTYSGLLIPNPTFGKKLSTTHISKRYFSALNYLDRINLEEIMTRMSTKVLVEGAYYGIVQTLDKDNLVIFDLPSMYCRSRFRDFNGNDLVEFNVQYFDQFILSDVKKEVLDSFPKEISAYYKKYKKGKVSNSWIQLPAEVGICFTLTEDCRPLLLNVIPATIQYDDAVDTERERELEEIRKIIVQQIPHLNDGTLLFEPDEALEMHQGAVNMMKKNKNISVLTSYANVDAIISKTSADTVSNSLEKMYQNIYSEAGASAQIFSPTGTQALSTSILNDISVMMILGNKYSRFFSFVINSLFSNANIYFKYKILPISLYNKSDFITDSFKLAQSGYSFLLPSIAAGIGQNELSSLKELENDVLKLRDVLLPLSSAYTQSSSSGEVGAPEKKLEEKSEKTIQNEDSLDRQGGSE